MGSQEISLIIKAQDAASAEIRKLQTQMDQLAISLGKTTEASAKTASGMSWLTNCHAKYIAVVAAGTQIIQGVSAAFAKVNEYINLGAEALKAEEAFGAMAQSIGVNAAKMTADMKSAAAGFVDDSHLMQKAAFAMAADIDPDKIPRVFEAARLAARLTGQDVTTAIDGMIQAISTNMPRSLRQMGMISKDQMTILNQAAAAGVTEINLLDIVLANATIRSAQLGDSQDNTAKQIKKFKVEIEELKESVGKTLITALQKAFGAFQWLASGVLSATAAIPKFMEMVSRLSAFAHDKIGSKDRAAVALKDAAQMESLYNDLLGAAGELANKGAANMSGSSGEIVKGPSPADAEKAKKDLARLMDDVKKRIAAGKGGSEIDKLREEWARIERELSADVAKQGLNEFEQKIVDIDRKVDDLKVKAAKLPTAGERDAAGNGIDAWSSAMKGQVGAEEASKRMSEARDIFLKGAQSVIEADKEVSAALQPELQKRIDQTVEAADKQRQAYLDAYNAGVLDAADYGRKIAAVDEAETKQRLRIEAEYDKSAREAQVKSRLAVLDLMEAEGAAHRTTISERIRLNEEMAASQQIYLDGLDKAKDPTAWYAQASALEETRKALAGLRREMDLQDPIRSVQRSLTDLTNNWTDVGQQMYDVAKSTAQAMQQSFSDFFFDAFQGKLNSLSDYINSFLQSVHRAIANALSQQLSAGITSGISGLLNPKASSASGSSNVSMIQKGDYFTVDSTLALVNHGGGKISEFSGMTRAVPASIFSAAPRYHEGAVLPVLSGPSDIPGLKHDELPAVLQRGEIVVPREGTPVRETLMQTIIRRIAGEETFSRHIENIRNISNIISMNAFSAAPRSLRGEPREPWQPQNKIAAWAKSPLATTLPTVSTPAYRIVPNLDFAGAPRFHGGFAPDEYPAVLQRGEGVFTAGQMKALGIMAGGGSSSQSPQSPQSVKVQIINESGQKVQASDSRVAFNLQEMVVTVWLDALDRNAYNLRGALGG